MAAVSKVSIMRKRGKVVSMLKDANTDAAQLNQVDLLRLQLGEAQLQICQRDMSLFELQKKLAEAEIQRAVAKHADAANAARKLAEQKLQEHKAFCQDIAKRYDIDWNTCSYDPETGAIRKTEV
jgi:hypothetical protein